MPDFTARMSSGGTVVDWLDPPTLVAPSRLNNVPTRPQRYLRVAPGSTILFRATVLTNDGPTDAELDGRLFQAWWAEWSGPYPPAIAQTSGSSSIATVVLTTAHLGHFVFVFAREDGGAVAIHFDVEAT